MRLRVWGWRISGRCGLQSCPGIRLWSRRCGAADRPRGWRPENWRSALHPMWREEPPLRLSGAFRRWFFFIKCYSNISIVVGYEWDGIFLYEARNKSWVSPKKEGFGFRHNTTIHQDGMDRLLLRTATPRLSWCQQTDPGALCRLFRCQAWCCDFVGEAWWLDGSPGEIYGSLKVSPQLKLQALPKRLFRSGIGLVHQIFGFYWDLLLLLIIIC